MKTAFLAGLVMAGMCAGCVSTEPERPVKVEIDTGQEAPRPIVATASAHGHDETVERLRAALESRPLTIFAEIDHAEGARQAGRTLGPSTLFVFGNPKMGSQLMQANPALGIELPLKILVMETDQGVQLLRQDVRALAEQYGLSPDQAPIGRMEETLKAIVSEAAG